MTVYKEFRIGGGGGNNRSPFGWIGSIIMLVVVLLLAYVLIRGIFTLLFWLSPIILIAGIAVDPKGALAFGKQIISYSKKNPLIPLAVIILSALFFPVVPGILGALAGGFLLTKGLIRKKMDKVFGKAMPQQEEDQYVEYEDVTEDESFLELPEIEKRVEKSTRSGNEYDNLFE